MFGRRRHVAPVIAAPAPQLTEDQVFDIVHAQVAAAIGERGEWTLTRRAVSDTDDIFHGVIAHSVTSHVIEALRAAREQLGKPEIAAVSIETVPPMEKSDELVGEHVAAEEESASIREPAAFSWQPAPITKWTDLKKPVTGPLVQIHDHELVA